jgi:FMN phosphatase YigB (HAD superfamily)
MSGPAPDAVVTFDLDGTLRDTRTACGSCTRRLELVAVPD